MDSQCFVQAATIIGIEAVPVTVEVNVGVGLPGFTIVGMPDKAVQEACMRVRLALRAAGYTFPKNKVTVNLAPSSLRKSGSGFDLPIAIGILCATGQICEGLVERSLFVGELSLDASVRPVCGLLAYAKVAAQFSRTLVCAPIEGESMVVGGVEYRCLRSLEDLHTEYFVEPQWSESCASPVPLDYADVAGHDFAKRALQLAAAGGHGVFMVGPPGAGKTMLAKRFPSILPPLSEDELVESALIYSVTGVPYEGMLQGVRPFRAPHHSASRAGLLGGGRPIRPGEVSLAHNGVLFLDEMPEFGAGTLQMLRQPIEDGCVSLARVDGLTVFPARFSLIGAANPCPCGYYGDPVRNCTCTPQQIVAYQQRIGGPLLDRFDIYLEIWRSDASSVLATGTGTSSAELRSGVLRARAFARSREEEERCSTGDAQAGDGVSEGAEERLLRACALGVTEHALLERLATYAQMSGRGIIRALRVARTIADMEESDRVKSEHIEEAFGYRARVEFGQ